MTTLNIRPINQVKIMTSSKFTIYNVVSYETQGLGLIRIPLSDLVLIWDQVSYETLSFTQIRHLVLYGTPQPIITASSLHQKRPQKRSVGLYP